MQPFDFILLVVIGDLIQSGVTQNDMSVTGVLIAVSTIGILQVAIYATDGLSRSGPAGRSFVIPALPVSR